MPVIPGPRVPLPTPPIPGSEQNQVYAGLVWATTLETETFAEVFPTAGNAAFDSSTAFSGSRSVKVTETGTASAATRTVPTSAIWVGRFWFRTDSIAPTAIQNIFTMTGTGVGTFVPTLRLSLTGHFQAGYATSTFASAPAALLNTWQAIDFRIDMRQTPHTIDWMVDGAAQTQAVSSAAAPAEETVNLFNIAAAGNNTLDLWYDDFQLSTDAGAYPLADLAGSVHFFSSAVADTGVSQTDTVGITIGRPVTDTGVSETDSVATTRLRPVSDTGVSETDTLVTTRVRPVTDTGVVETDTIATTRVRAVVDTGVSETDTVATTRVRAVTDTGVSQTDSVATTRVRVIADTGVSETDTVATKRLRVVTDTGLSETDSVSAVRGPNISVTTTGVTQTDTVSTTRLRVVTDTGISQTDSTSTLRARFISTTGVTQSDSVALTRGFLRAVSDTGASQSDSTSTLRVRFVVTIGVTQSDVVAVGTTRIRGVADTGLTETDSVFAHAGIVIHPDRAYVGYVNATAISGVVSGTGLTGIPAT